MNASLTRLARHALAVLVCSLVLLGASTAHAGPFDSTRLPADAQAIGHVDVDALRTTKLFAAITARTGKDLDKGTPAPLKPLVNELASSTTGVSFWLDADGNGALVVAVKDGKKVDSLVKKFPKRAAMTVAGVAGHRITIEDAPILVAVVGDTLVLSRVEASMKHTVEVLAGKAKGLQSSALPASVKTAGMFFVAALDQKALAAASQQAASALLKADLVSLTLGVGEVKGELHATASAEVGTEKAAQQIKGVLEGMRALVGLADDTKQLAPIVDATTVTVTGKQIDISLAMSSTQLIDLLEAAQKK